MIVAMTARKRREDFDIGPDSAVWTGALYGDRHNDRTCAGTWGAGWLRVPE